MSQGCEELISQIASLAVTRDRPTSNKNILVTTGSQQGLDLVARLFINNGDRIAVTRPCYLGALQAFAPMNPVFLEVSSDENGPILSELEKALSQSPKFFYLVPAFQNPTGQSVSEERARAIIKMCRQAKVPIIEDAAYEGLFYEQLPKSLRSLETEICNDYDLDGGIIYLGTFSKVIAPGLRIGWIEAPEEIAKLLVVLKQSSDLHSSTLNQLITADFLIHYAQDYWQFIRQEYVKKRDLMLDLVKSKLGKYLTYHSNPKGGLFIWVETEARFDFSQLLGEAVEKHNVAYVPGAPFFAKDPINNCLRLSFATAKPADMEKGLEAISSLLAAK